MLMGMALTYIALLLKLSIYTHARAEQSFYFY